MIAPRKYVHMFLIFSELIIIGIICLIMAIYTIRPKKHSKYIVWIASKILTVNKLIKQNNYEIYPILDINSNNIKKFYNQNYETLLKHSNKNCENYYKKYGLLDILGNIMCIPENEECPINEVIVDYDFKYDEYISKGYKVSFLERLSSGYNLYYTNKAINNKIVAKLDLFDTYPKYITEDNFIFDSDTYKRNSFETIGVSSFDDDNDWDDRDDFGGSGGDDIGAGEGGFRNLIGGYHGDEKTTRYINNSFNAIDNVDKSFQYVGNNLYIGNYIGFRDYNNKKTFMDIDLYYLFLYPFPNEISFYLCCPHVVSYIMLIVISLTRCCHKDQPNEGSNKKKL